MIVVLRGGGKHDAMVMACDVDVETRTCSYQGFWVVVRMMA